VKIKMLEDAPGSPDGIHVQDYEKDVEYDVTDSLGEAFVQHGHAELAEPTPEPEPEPEPEPTPEPEPEPTPEPEPEPEPEPTPTPAAKPKRKPRAKSAAKDAGAQPENKSE
jgi:outer membrane biosynthesis protein TonB